MEKVSLTASMRSNLLSLQNISRQVDQTQNRLSTGKKVNSALDNPGSYYTARALDNRASDLSALLDSMGQAVSTIKAATEGIEAGLNLLEQMKSVAEQALENPAEIGAVPGGDDDTEETPDLETGDLQDFLDAGYTALTADMSVDDINALLSQPGAKLVLAEDLTLDNALMITQSNVTLEGNGHKLSITDTDGTGAGILAQNADGLSIHNIRVEFTSGTDIMSTAVAVAGGSADISAIEVYNPDDYGYGIIALQGGKLTLDVTGGIEVPGVGGQKVAGGDKSGFYDGRANTQAIVAQLGEDALAAYAATQFYPDAGLKDDATFGQGKWYLPAIGELMEMYGTDMSQVSDEFYGTSGATGDNMDLINDALSTLSSKGVEAATIRDEYVWSSSENDSGTSWGLFTSNGDRYNLSKDYNHAVRCFQLVENCFTPSSLSGAGGTGGAAAPKIGDVMYADKSYGSAADYDGSKVAVGIVVSVSAEDGSAKIVNLKGLTFSSEKTAGGFDPADPYGQRYGGVQWCTDDRLGENISGVPDFMAGSVTITGAKGAGVGSARADTGIRTGGDDLSGAAGDAGAAETAPGVSASYVQQYNEILRQYDLLIDDSSYKGINLLRGDELGVVFNEMRLSRLDILGQDIGSDKIGLLTTDWTSAADASAALDEVRRAINTLRSVSGELGNNYSMVQNRQEFTEELINILTEGSDKLTLADMNEESANMLALQTRQQLAVNSLSLASQASQAILKLF